VKFEETRRALQSKQTIAYNEKLDLEALISELKKKHATEQSKLQDTISNMTGESASNMRAGSEDTISSLRAAHKIEVEKLQDALSKARVERNAFLVNASKFEETRSALQSKQLTAYNEKLELEASMVDLKKTHKSELSELQDEIASLKKAQHASLAVKEENSGRRAAHEEEVAKLQEALTRANDEHRVEILEFEKAVASLKCEQRIADSAKSEMEASFQKLAQSRDQDQKKIGNLEQGIQILQREVEELREKAQDDPVPVALSRARKEHEKDLEAKISELKQEHAREIQAVKDKLAANSKKAEASHSRQSSAANLKLKLDMAKLAEENRRLADEKQKETDARQGLVSENEKLQERLTGLLELGSKASSIEAKLKTVEAEKKSLEEEIRELKLKSQSNQSEKRGLEDEVERLKSEVKDKAELQEQVKSLTDQLATTEEKGKNEHIRVQKLARDKLEIRQTKEAEVKQLKTQLQEKSNAEVELLKNVARLEENVAKLQAEAQRPIHEDLTEEVAQLKTKNEKLTLTVKQLMASQPKHDEPPSLAALSRIMGNEESGAITALKQKHEKEIEDTMEQAQQLEEHFKAKNQTLESENEGLKQALHELQDKALSQDQLRKNEQLEQTNQELREKLNLSDDRNDTTKKSLEKVKSEAENLKVDNAARLAEIGKLKEEKEALEDQIAQNQSEVLTKARSRRSEQSTKKYSSLEDYMNKEEDEDPQLEELKVKLSLLEEENEGNKRRADEADKLAHRVTELDAGNKALQRALEQKDGEISKLSAEIVKLSSMNTSEVLKRARSGSGGRRSGSESRNDFNTPNAGTEPPVADLPPANSTTTQRRRRLSDDHESSDSLKFKPAQANSMPLLTSKPGERKKRQDEKKSQSTSELRVGARRSRKMSQEEIRKENLKRAFGHQTMWNLKSKGNNQRSSSVTKSDNSTPTADVNKPQLTLDYSGNSISPRRRRRAQVSSLTPGTERATYSKLICKVSGKSPNKVAAKLKTSHAKDPHAYYLEVCDENNVPDFERLTTEQVKQKTREEQQAAARLSNRSSPSVDKQLDDTQIPRTSVESSQSQRLEEKKNDSQPSSTREPANEYADIGPPPVYQPDSLKKAKDTLEAVKPTSEYLAVPTRRSGNDSASEDDESKEASGSENSESVSVSIANELNDKAKEDPASFSLAAMAGMFGAEQRSNTTTPSASPSGSKKKKKKRTRLVRKKKSSKKKKRSARPKVKGKR